MAVKTRAELIDFITGMPEEFVVTLIEISCDEDLVSIAKGHDDFEIHRHVRIEMSAPPWPYRKLTGGLGDP